MTNRKLFPGLCILLLWLASLACNLPLTGSGSTTLILPTLTPFPTPEFIQTDFVPDPVFFVEEFDQGVPEDWKSTPNWTGGNGILSTDGADAELEVPGFWQDLTLFTRLRFDSTGFALQFNRSETGAYQINFTREGISLSWQPNEGEWVALSNTPITIDNGWHDLVLRQAHGKVEVILDQQPVLKQFNLSLSAGGSLKLFNSSAGLLEIDRLVVAPPGMGPGGLSPTPAPDRANLDLALVEVTVESNGELIVWLINNGPDSTQGLHLELTISIAPGDPAMAIYPDPLPVQMDVEWVNLFSVETGILIDPLYRDQQVTISLQPFDFYDPDPTNNTLNQDLPARLD